MKHQGNLIINTKADALKYKDITEVTGGLSIEADAKLDALTTVGGGLSIRADAKLDALTTVGGYLSIEADAKLDALTTVGGGLYIRVDAKLDALTTVGGGLSICADAKLNAPHAKYNQDMFAAFMKLGYIYADGILTTAISKRKCAEGYLYKTKRLARDEIIYVIQNGDTFAHGSTKEEARSDLIFKLSDRDTSAYKAMPLDTKKTPQEWAAIYRICTGACQTGTQMFIERQGKLKRKYTLAEIIAITKGAYESDKFLEAVA